MSIQIDWGSNPIVVRSFEENKLSMFLTFLNENGIKRHSTIMPDREISGHIFFVYEKIDEEIMKKWKEGN
tara:strand:- start:753 stop:962 length:210 start_codon:yes stop_codon:yes gene_type:complete